METSTKQMLSTTSPVRERRVSPRLSMANKKCPEQYAVQSRHQNSSNLSRISAQSILHMRSSVYAIAGMAELLKVAFERGRLDQVQHHLSLLMSNAASLNMSVTNTSADPLVSPVTRLLEWLEKAT